MSPRDALAAGSHGAEIRVGPAIAPVIALFVVAPILLPATPATSWSPVWLVYAMETGVHARDEAAGLVCGVLLVWATYLRQAWCHPDRRTVWLLMAALLAAYGVPTLLHSAPASVIGGNSALLLAMACGLLAARLAGTAWRTAAVLIAAASLQAVSAYCGYISREHIVISGNLVRAGGTFDAPNALGLLLATALPLSTTAVHLSGSTIRTFACAASAMALYCGVLLSGSRAAALGAFAGVVLSTVAALPLLSDRSSRRTALAVAVASGMLLVTVNGLRNWDWVGRQSTARSTRGHVSYWQGGLSTFRNHWRTGAGGGSAMVSIPVQANGVTEEVEVPVSNNLFIQWLAEFGVAGGALYVILAMAVVATLRVERGHISAGLSGAWTAYAVGTWFVPAYGPANRPGGVLFGMLIGMTIFCVSETEHRAVSSGRPE